MSANRPPKAAEKIGHIVTPFFDVYKHIVFLLFFLHSAGMASWGPLPSDRSWDSPNDSGGCVITLGMLINRYQRAAGSCAPSDDSAEGGRPASSARDIEEF